MLKTPEKYDLNRMLEAIAEDLKYQRVDEQQKKDVSQEAITELMIDNIKRKHKPHD